MLDLKKYLIDQLKSDVEELGKEYKKQVDKLNDAIADLEKLTDEEVLGEVSSQVDNIRFLAQFTSLKKVRDAAKEKMEAKGGEVPSKE